MRPHRALAPRLEPTIVLPSSEAAHLRVLRAQVGDVLTVFDGAGLEAKAVILEVGERFVLQLEPAQKSSLEPPQPLTLAIALLKADKLSDVVRAATELGVAKIQLLQTQHSQAKDIGVQKLERLRRIAAEAAKQCQRNVIPDVLKPVALEALSAPGVVAHPHSALLPHEAVHWDAPFCAVCGPEGGFSSREIALLEEKGIVRVTLGRRILRAETAALALVSSLTAAQGF
ncbi:MAG: 16S rRNA (uracil(1498)-N(3))-methyltransferase [Deinococcales bacterium]